jgi:hypothetical protein
MEDGMSTTQMKYEPWMALEFMKLIRGPFGWWWVSVDEFVRAVNARGKNFQDPEQILKEYIAVSKKMGVIHIWDRRSKSTFDEVEVSLLRSGMISKFMLSWKRDFTEDDPGEISGIEISNPYLPADFVKTVMGLVDMGVRSVEYEISDGQIIRTAHFFGTEIDIVTRGDLATSIVEYRQKMLS